MRSRWIPLTILLVLFGGILAAIVSISVGEYEAEEFRIEGAGEVQELIGGIAQTSGTLGDPDAEITIDVFTDVQSPRGAEYQLEVVDPLIEQYARTGEAKMVLRHFPLGPKPITFAGIASEAAGLQDRQWQYAELFMRNLDAVPEQGVSVAFLGEVASRLPELDVTVWEADIAGADPTSEAGMLADEDEALATELRLGADPAIVVSGPAGSEVLEEGPSLEEIEAAIEVVR
jgi:protein-disulfide isomerase